MAERARRRYWKSRLQSRKTVSSSYTRRSPLLRRRVRSTINSTYAIKLPATRSPMIVHCRSGDQLVGFSTSVAQLSDEVCIISLFSCGFSVASPLSSVTVIVGRCVEWLASSPWSDDMFGVACTSDSVSRIALNAYIQPNSSASASNLLCSQGDDITAS